MIEKDCVLMSLFVFFGVFFRENPAQYAFNVCEGGHGVRHTGAGVNKQ